MFRQTTISEVTFFLLSWYESCVITSLERVCVENEEKVKQLTVTKGMEKQKQILSLSEKCFFRKIRGAREEEIL